MNKTPIDSSYIAGFFDGEGSAMILTIRRKLNRGIVYRFRPVIKIDQKTLMILMAIKDYIGFGHIDSRGGSHTYVINGLEGVWHFCRKVGPFIQIKRDALDAIQGLVLFQHRKKLRNEPYTLNDTEYMITLRDKSFSANCKTRSGLKQKYSWLQIIKETDFVVDIEAWKEHRMRGIRRLHSESH